MYQILLLTFFEAVISAVGVFFFFNLIPPNELSILLLVMLYLFIFLMFLGGFSFFGVLLRVYVFRAKVPMRALARSFRQSSLLAFLVTTALLLSHIRMLSLWSLVFLVVAAGFLEMFFLTSRTRVM